MIAGKLRPHSQKLFHSIGDGYCSARLLRGRGPPRLSKKNSGLHLGWFAISQVQLEGPLHQGISNDLNLVRKSADEMDVLYPAFFADDDSDRNRVKPIVFQKGLNFRGNAVSAGIIPDAYRGSAATLRSCVY